MTFACCSHTCSQRIYHQRDHIGRLVGLWVDHSWPADGYCRYRCSSITIRHHADLWVLRMVTAYAVLLQQVFATELSGAGAQVLWLQPLGCKRSTPARPILLAAHPFSFYPTRSTRRLRKSTVRLGQRRHRKPVRRTTNQMHCCE
jgi:hypothetical protein